MVFKLGLCFVCLRACVLCLLKATGKFQVWNCQIWTGPDSTNNKCCAGTKTLAVRDVNRVKCCGLILPGVCSLWALISNPRALAITDGNGEFEVCLRSYEHQVGSTIFSIPSVSTDFNGGKVSRHNRLNRTGVRLRCTSPQIHTQ